MPTPSYYERNLPHYQPPHTTFLVNMRLAGSLPMQAVERLRQEYEASKRKNTGKLPTSGAIAAYRDRQFKYFLDVDRLLDTSRHGPQWLHVGAVAETVRAAIHSHDKMSFYVLAFCIMPNHVHIVMAPLVERTEVRSTRLPGSQYHLTRIMRQLKGSTARKANLLLKRTGAFWQHESYDHVIRDVEELERIIWYVINNPVAAGLVEDWKDWKWTYLKESLLQTN